MTLQGPAEPGAALPTPDAVLPPPVRGGATEQPVKRFTQGGHSVPGRQALAGQTSRAYSAWQSDRAVQATSSSALQRVRHSVNAGGGHGGQLVWLHAPSGQMPPE